MTCTLLTNLCDAPNLERRDMSDTHRDMSDTPKHPSYHKWNWSNLLSSVSPACGGSFPTILILPPERQTPYPLPPQCHLPVHNASGASSDRLQNLRSQGEDVPPRPPTQYPWSLTGTTGLVSAVVTRVSRDRVPKNLLLCVFIRTAG